MSVLNGKLKVINGLIIDRITPQLAAVIDDMAIKSHITCSGIVFQVKCLSVFL